MEFSPITSWQIDGEIMGSRVTAYGDCSHEIKRRLLLGRKAMTNLDNILKNRDITLPKKVYLVKAIVQFSHPYMTTGKTIALTRWTFVAQAMSLFFNMLSRFVIAFLSRSKHLLISWLHETYLTSWVHENIFKYSCDNKPYNHPDLFVICFLSIENTFMFDLIF